MLNLVSFVRIRCIRKHGTTDLLIFIKKFMPVNNAFKKTYWTHKLASFGSQILRSFQRILLKLGMINWSMEVFFSLYEKWENHWYINKCLHLTRKYAPIFFHGSICSMQELNGFPRNTFSVSFMYKKQIIFKDEHPSIYFRGKWRYCVYYASNIFRNAHGQGFSSPVANMHPCFLYPWSLAYKLISWRK